MLLPILPAPAAGRKIFGIAALSAVSCRPLWAGGHRQYRREINVSPERRYGRSGGPWAASAQEDIKFSEGRAASMKCLVIGGGGPVGMGLLYLFKHLGWTAAVVDPKRPRHPAVHDRLLAGTLESWTEQTYGLDELDRRLAAERFDAVVDLSPTMDKRGRSPCATGGACRSSTPRWSTARTTSTLPPTTSWTAGPRRRSGRTSWPRA